MFRPDGRDIAEAVATTANFTIHWGGVNELFERLGITPTGEVAELVRLAMARQRLLATIQKAGRDKQIECLRFLSVLEKGAKRVRSYETADDLARFLFGG